jgi:phytoene desaturase
MARTVGIIGSGIGALAAGLRLLSKGFQVTIFESRSIAGGKASGVTVEGHLLDSGPTILRMPQLYIDLFSSVGMQFGESFVARMLSPLYRIYKEPGNYLDISTSIEEVTKEIARFSSIDANHYNAFLQRTHTIHQENLSPPPIDTTAKKPFFRFSSKGVLRIQPSVFQEITRHFQNPFIQQSFSFHPLLFGDNPFTAHSRNLMLYAIEQQWGIVHIEGGFHQVIASLLKRFRELGGQLELNTPVSQIMMEKQQAFMLRLPGGRNYHFDALISNVSPFLTEQLINPDPKESTTSTRQSTSFFMLHLLAEPDGSELHPHTILPPRNYGAFVQKVFTQKQLPDDPWLYIYAQSNQISDLQPLMIMTPVPNLGTPMNWGKNAFNFRNRVIEKVERFFPGLNHRIHYERISTPINWQEEFNLPDGSPLHSPLRRSPANLFYVGDNTWTGLGLMAALSSGEQVAKTIINSNTAMV